jgi:hypothetical protein
VTASDTIFLYIIGPTGQLGHNDAKVNNIGSLLDPSATTVHVPD